MMTIAGKFTSILIFYYVFIDPPVQYCNLYTNLLRTFPCNNTLMHVQDRNYEHAC